MYYKLLAAGLFFIALSSCHKQPDSEQSQAEGPVTSSICERDCLEAIMENYLQALAAQDVSRIKVTDDVVFAENNQLLELGDGSWRTFTGTGTYRHYFTDPQTRQVAVISTMRENGEGVIYDLRLRLRGERISEIESMVIRTPAGAAKYEELATPPPNFVSIIPEAQRNSRDEMLAIPYKYLKGMENNDPSGDYSFFDKYCNRYEHALKTTNSEPQHVGHTESTTFSTMTCEAQFSGGGLAFVTRMRDERYRTNMVVDEERQAIFGFVFLDHNGTVRSINRADGSVSIIPPYFSTPRSLNVGEAWRIKDNKLFEIEMTLTEVPYGMRPQFGLDEDNAQWLQTRNINPDNIHLDKNCDGPCLNAATDDFLNALVSRDHSHLPLSPDVSYHENGIELAIGDGLWGTMTELADYRVYLSNPATGEAGFFGTIVETDVRGLLSARLLVKDGLIEDINITVMRHEFNTSRGGTLSLFYPQIDGMFNPDSFSEIETAVDKPLIDISTADLVNNLLNNADYRDSHVLISDPAKSLVLQQSIQDFVNTELEQRDTRSSGSYSVLTSSLWGLAGDEPSLLNSTSKVVPYRMKLPALRN